MLISFSQVANAVFSSPSFRSADYCRVAANVKLKKNTTDAVYSFS